MSDHRRFPAGTRPGPTAVVIFGAGGDLAWRKLVPALYNLFNVQQSSVDPLWKLGQ